MNKKIVFFDATGTLWYPKITRNNTDPGWIYKDKHTQGNVHKHLILTPTTKTTLEYLNRTGILCMIISAVPYPLYKSRLQLGRTIIHFNLEKLIHAYYVVNMVDGSSKARLIERVLKKLKIKKTQALMIGDGYWQDYKFVRKRGIQALLVNSKY